MNTLMSIPQKRQFWLILGSSISSEYHNAVSDLMSLMILDIRDFISDIVLLYTKNKAVSHEYINVNTPKTSILANFRVIYI